MAQPNGIAAAIAATKSWLLSIICAVAIQFHANASNVHKASLPIPFTAKPKIAFRHANGSAGEACVNDASTSTRVTILVTAAVASPFASAGTIMQTSSPTWDAVRPNIPSTASLTMDRTHQKIADGPIAARKPRIDPRKNEITKEDLFKKMAVHPKWAATSDIRYFFTCCGFTTGGSVGGVVGGMSGLSGFSGFPPMPGSNTQPNVGDQTQ
jgi:hypothetical protein